MKSILILITYIVLSSFTSKAQTITDIDEITPFHEELSAIKKSSKWTFINPRGEIKILDKIVISYSYNEVVIDTLGN